MDPISDGCRLCLDPFAECFTTIDNPQLKDQMEKVFCFSIEPKQGFCSSVCQSCSYAISEFYQFSEKVRQNQEVLNGNVPNCDLSVDSKITLASVKVEKLNDSVLPETIEDACEPRDEVFEEVEIPIADSNITVANVKFETFSDPELPETSEHIVGEKVAIKFDHNESYESPSEKSETDVPTKKFRKLSMKRQLQLEKEDQLFNKHFRMICNICGTSETSFTELAHHFLKKHNESRAYVVCCNKKIIGRCFMRDHINYHSNPDMFRCELCEKKYKNKCSLDEHMAYKHSSTDHVKLECPKCNKTFFTKNSLTTHMTKLHSGKDRRMVCDTCGKGFLSKQNYDRHMNEHMGNGAKWIQCKMCNRMLKGEQSLQNHMKWVHSDGGDEKLQCDICQQEYSNSRALYHHKLYTHAEPKHECEFCGKKFKRMLSLKDHRIVHTGEAHTCEYCGQANNSKSYLYRHIKKHHPTEWAEKKRIAPRRQ